MTDPFEDIVRDALRGTTGAADDLPTYHEAWQRGRRRRLIKRSALAAAGAFVILAALTVNLGPLPGSEPTETSDVATSAEAATPVFEPTPLTTTAPVETPLAASQQTNAIDSVPAEPTAPVTSPLETSTTAPPPAMPPAAAPPTAVPPTALPPTAVPPTTVPPAAAAPAAVPPTAAPPTAVPQTRVPTDPVPTVEAQSSALSPTVEAVPTVEAATAQDQDPASSAGTAQQPADPGSTDELPVAPELAFTTAAPVDAVLLGGAARGVGIPCDLDQDGVADATCALLADYSCTGDGDVQPGYSVVDTNGDQVGDTCSALDLTICDTTNDGFGDTPCIIDVSTVPEG